MFSTSIILQQENSLIRRIMLQAAETKTFQHSTRDCPKWVYCVVLAPTSAEQGKREEERERMFEEARVREKGCCACFSHSPERNASWMMVA